MVKRLDFGLYKQSSYTGKVTRSYSRWDLEINLLFKHLLPSFIEAIKKPGTVALKSIRTFDARKKCG